MVNIYNLILWIHRISLQTQTQAQAQNRANQKPTIEVIMSPFFYGSVVLIKIHQTGIWFSKVN